MSLWVDSVTVAGLAFITYGTFAQAMGSRADFKILKDAIDRIDIELNARALDEARERVMRATRPEAFGMRLAGRHRWAYYILFGPRLVWAIVYMRIWGRPPTTSGRRMAHAIAWVPWTIGGWATYVREIRAAGGEDAVELARLLRQSVVWAIICFGSLLVLIAAVVSLIYDATAS
jgi:hypothetical protein